MLENVKFTQADEAFVKADRYFSRDDHFIRYILKQYFRSYRLG